MTAQLNAGFEIEVHSPIDHQQIALEMVLLFHSVQWSSEASLAWQNRFVAIFKDGRSSEATTKNLCDAVRKVLSEQRT